jgi:hypothetical protein
MPDNPQDLVDQALGTAVPPSAPVSPEPVKVAMGDDTPLAFASLPTTAAQ